MFERIINNEFAFREYGVSVLHPIALLLTLVVCILVLFLHRRYALISMITLCLFIPEYQRVVIGSADLNIMKIMVIILAARIYLRERSYSLKFNTLDKRIILWIIFSILVYTVLWGTAGAFVSRIGYAMNSVGLFFVFRYMIRDIYDIEQILLFLAIISMLLAFFLIIEKSTGMNQFSIFGHAPEISAIRHGRLRCQGPFAHPILVGTFGATLFPLMIALYVKNRSLRIITVGGIIASAIITLCSASSGPLLAYLSGILGLFLWYVRRYMRVIRWGLFILLIALHLVMKGPVWALMAKVGVFGGSTGWHRYFLIDQFINRFSEWAAFGTKSTVHWGWGLQDVTNQFVLVGVEGGIFTLIMYIWVIATCFQYVGRAIKSEKNIKTQFFFWGLGTSLVVHLLSFISVSYFDQMVLFWFLLLSMISTIFNLKDKA